MTSRNSRQRRRRQLAPWQKKPSLTTPDIPGGAGCSFFHPRHDMFDDLEMPWISNVGGEGPTSLERLLQVAGNNNPDMMRDFNAMLDLMYLRFTQQPNPVFEEKFLINYTEEDFLNPTPTAAKSQTTEYKGSALIKFFAHLLSMQIDYDLGIPTQDLPFYQRAGLLGHNHRTTELFRQLPLYQFLEQGQKQLDGMPYQQPLQILSAILGRIAANPNHRSQAIAQMLLPVVNGMNYLKTRQDAAAKNDKTLRQLSRELAGHLLNSAPPVKFSMQTGYHGHAFYVNANTTLNPDSSKSVRFIIHNFNSIVTKTNNQPDPNENNFKPYVLEIKIPKDATTATAKKEIIRYLNLLQLSKARHNAYVEKHKDHIPTFAEKRYIELIKRSLTKQTLEQIAKKVKNNGKFSYSHMQEYFQTPDCNAFLQRTLGQYLWKQASSNHFIMDSIYQYLQTQILLGVIYHPEQDGFELLRPNPEYALTLPGYPSQRVGNCTVHNLKSAMYEAIGLDWGKSNDYEDLLKINFDIDAGVIDLIKQTNPLFATTTVTKQFSIVKKIPAMKCNVLMFT